MNSKFAFPSVCYVSDAAVNNAETLFNRESPSVTSLIDLISIVQAAVLNESLVISPLALQQSTLLQQLDFVETYQGSEKTKGGETVLNITAPAALQQGSTPLLIGYDENGELSADSAVGDLLIAIIQSGKLQDDDILGSFMSPERLQSGVSRGDAYLAKFAGFMLWLQADRDIGPFANEEARQEVVQRAEKSLKTYRLVARRLLACRDKFGLDLACSVIERPLFSLSVAQEVTSPFEYLEKFDEAVHDAIVAAREDAFEKWNFPSVGAVVLANARRLGDLPTQISKARSKLMKARNNVRSLNMELWDFEREMNLGDDRHFQEINRIKVTLQKAIDAFGANTEYQKELEAFPLTERIWWMPKLLVTVLGAMKSPDKALKDIAAMPWVRRQSYLRYVPGMTGASSYVKKARKPIMRHLICDLLKMDFEKAAWQSQTVDWAIDLTERCSDLRPTDRIGNNLLTVSIENREDLVLSDKSVWALLVQSEVIRKQGLVAYD